jgi:hypothetical protein
MANLLEGLWQIVRDADSKTWELSWPGGGITRMTGIYLPPANRASQRTPTQHGSTELGFRLEDREVIIGLGWAARTRLVDTRRRHPYPALGYGMGPLTVRRTLRDHTQLELRQCYYGGGLEGDSAQSFDDQEYVAFRLLCRDPAWYDPASHSLTLTYSSFIHAVYGDFATVDSGDGLTTDGDWYAYPTIALTGPCEDFDLRSTTTGQRLRYYGDVAAGEVVTIVCNPHPAYLSATSTVQGNVEKWIYPADDFGGFCLWYDPLAGAGANVWELDTVGMTAASSVVFTWEDRWQGA